MAGSYPDIPNYRMPYDRDGTVGILINNLNEGTTVAPSVLASLNNETGNVWPVEIAGGGSFVLIFPELRDLTHILMNGWLDGFSTNDPGTTFPVYVSEDTTNGVDGTWSGPIASADAPLFTTHPVKDHYRKNIQTISGPGVRALKFDPSEGATTRIGKLHLYGEHAAGSTADRLRFWHPTLDEPAGPAYLDFGNVPRGAVITRSLRVKNVSDETTAQQVRVAMEVLTDANPSLVNQFALSLDGTSWLAQVDVGDLAPGAVSAVFQIRYTASATAQLSVWDVRLFSEAQTWTVI